MNTETIEQQVQATLENKTADVRDAVRQITLKALSGGELDTAALRRVMDAVVKGAQRGAASRGEQGRQALSDAMKGLDEALAVAAEATQLALQEAAGRTSEFSRHEIERALDDLKGLESLFIETLSDAARSATGFAEATLRDLAGHARSSGTAVGHQVTAAAAQLGDAIAGTAETQLETGTQTLRASGALLASMASGMLAGIAERLQSASGGKTGKKSPGSSD